jgi:putative ABC transport system permease protein
MLKNHIKIAWRNSTKHKGFTLIHILGLALGIGASLIIFLITSFELSYDRFHPDGDRIYRLVADEQDKQSGNTGHIGGMSNPLPIALRKDLTGFDAVTEFQNYYANITIPNGNNTRKTFDAVKRGEEPSPIIITEPQYFEIFKYRWLEGNPATALNEPNKVVLSKSEAEKYFGPRQPAQLIGKQIIYKDLNVNDSLRLTISGIVDDWQQNTDLAFKDFISFATIQHSFLKQSMHMDNWGNWNPNAQGFVKLAKGTTPVQLEKQFPRFIAAHSKPNPAHTTELLLQPLNDLHFNSAYRDSYTRHAHLPTLYALMGIAVFILLIAAINFINLSTAQSIQRAKEIGVRKVLGSSKTNLRMQILIETLLITLLATILSAALAGPALSLSRSFIPAGVKLNLADPAAIGFLSLITLFTTGLAGYYPAKVLASYSPIANLKGSQPADKSTTLRKTLIVFQFTISLVFIIAALVVGSQIHFIRNKDLGFAKDEIITLRTGWNDPADQVSGLANRLRQLPAVGSVSTHLETPAAKGHSNTWIKRVDEPEYKIGSAYEMCDENYVPLYGLHIIAGRNILHSDSTREFLINETAVKDLGFNNAAAAIGKPVLNGMNEANGTIVGVLKDFNSQSLHEKITPFFLSSYKPFERAVSIKLAAADLHFNTTLEKIESIWKEIYPDKKFEYSFFDETIARLYAEEQTTAKLMNTAVIIAIFISCMGLFGLATFSALQRKKEIGIRRILGAGVIDIASMLSIDFLKLVGIAIVIASPVAYYFTHRWLDGFAYRVSISAWVFILAGGAAIGITLLTVSFQAIRAATASPVKSLRTE